MRPLDEPKAENRVAGLLTSVLAAILIRFEALWTVFVSKMMTLKKTALKENFIVQKTCMDMLTCFMWIFSHLVFRFQYSEKPTKARPVILEGGFYDFLLHYPQHTTDPNTQLPRPQNQNQRMRIDQIRYPTMHIFRAYEPPSSPELPRKVVAFSEVLTDINEVRWKQTYSDDTGITHKEESTSKMISTYQEHFSRRNGDISKQVVNGDVFKQVLAGPEKSPKLTAAKPTVNRSLKPSGSNHAIVGENSEQPSLLASGSSATDLRDKLRPPETGPNVTIRRGSAESNVSGNESDHGDSAKENVPKILPEVQRDNKPREIATVPAQRPASADYSSKLVSTTKGKPQ